MDKKSYIQKDKIDVAALLSGAYAPSAGGVVVFVGTVRNINKGKKVVKLDYEVYHEMANKMIAEILKDATAKWGLDAVKCIHREGEVGVSETAVVVITASKHRKEAYEANQFIIHELKHTVPIWKKELYEDGSYEWGNNCNC